MKISDFLFKLATKGCKGCPYKEWCSKVEINEIDKNKNKK